MRSALSSSSGSASLSTKPTDIVILVVAADDSVKPQTEEAYNHAKDAGVQIIVAINKIDTPDADIEKVKGDLSAIGLVPEDWGGDTQMIPVSAKNGDGMNDLLESIQLVSELMELKTNHSGPAAGIVLESGVRKGEGAVHLLLTTFCIFVTALIGIAFVVVVH